MVLDGLRITHAVVGCSDVDVTASFFETLGLTEIRTERIPGELAAPLYGHRRALETLALSAPGSRVGWIRLIEAEGPPRVWRPYRTGPVLLEFDTRSMAEAVACVQDAGAQPAGRTTYSGETGQVQEVRLIGPDGIGIGLIESTGPRPRLLGAGREFSELSSTLWVVESVAAALPGYPEFEVSLDFAAEEYEPVAEFLGLPEASAAIRTVMLGERGAPLERLQLLEFSGRTVEPGPAGWPIRPGIFAVGCEAIIESPMAVERAGGVRLEVWPAVSHHGGVDMR